MRFENVVDWSKSEYASDSLYFANKSMNVFGVFDEEIVIVEMLSMTQDTVTFKAVWSSYCHQCKQVLTDKETTVERDKFFDYYYELGLHCNDCKLSVSCDIELHCSHFEVKV